MASTAPQSKSQPLPPDTSTEPLPRFTSLSGYRTGDLTEGRRMVSKELKYLWHVPFATLVRSAFGSPVDSEISQIRQTLTGEGVLSAVQSIPSLQSNLPESEAFGPLGDVISKIFEQVPTCPFSFAATPLSSRLNTSRPDAYIACSGTHRAHWFDIAIPFEFKKENSDIARHDNKLKMIWSLRNIKHEDPLRRFTFGITVEDTDMRIWCSNHSFFAISVPINFTTEIDDVISLFYLIGTKTNVGLGWDPTVERICNGISIRYKFTIGNQCQCFTMTPPLAMYYGADAVVGRGTRVYEGQDENGNKVAKKDSWRDQDREPESAIQEKIFEDIRDKLGEEKATEAKKYFVRVRVYEDNVSGNTHKMLIRENEEDVKWITIDADPPFSNSRHTSSMGHIPDTGCLPSEARRVPCESNKILCRIYARTVFWDVGIALVDVPGLADSFSCLSDARRGLYYLHKAGCVHGDLSVANILWVGGVGKLTDFDAKKVDSESSHDGTMHFVAIEVASQRYRFSPQELAPPGAPFRMNLLHDLESLWWAAIWILFYNTDEDAPAEATQLQWFDKAFPPFIWLKWRHDFFTQDIADACKTLSSTYKAQSERIIRLALHLQNFYRQAEQSSPPSLEAVLEPAHREVSDAFSEVVECLKGSNIRLRPMHETLGGKRACRIA